MSWLSDRTGIHIGSKPKQMDLSKIQADPNIPPEVKQAMIESYLNGPGKAIDRAGTLNQDAMILAGTLLGAQGLAGATPIFGGAPAAGTVAGGGATAGGGAAGGGSIAGSIWDKVKKGAGAVNGAIDTASGNGVLDKVLMAAGIYEAQKEAAEKKRLMNEGKGFVTDAYSARQPLRHRGLELMQDETAPDLSAIFVNQQNPYTKARTPYQVSARQPMPPVVPTSGSY